MEAQRPPPPGDPWDEVLGPAALGSQKHPSAGQVCGHKASCLSQLLQQQRGDRATPPVGLVAEEGALRSEGVPPPAGEATHKALHLRWGLLHHAALGKTGEDRPRHSPCDSTLPCVLHYPRRFNKQLQTNTEQGSLSTHQGTTSSSVRQGPWSCCHAIKATDPSPPGPPPGISVIETCRNLPKQLCLRWVQGEAQNGSPQGSYRAGYRYISTGRQNSATMQPPYWPRWRHCLILH
ncbi:hypothetical protein NDU88_002531 [Pleurodeles waltl]|uniref:Uncharacterized protein n=1 Tax=Pleurodeles waltl TaxID=8319 RepID=A0AAV7RE80_PLEWA|nr:hypothetical protein NDU88_002531 [Pleurodeles waltl]